MIFSSRNKNLFLTSFANLSLKIRCKIILWRLLFFYFFTKKTRKIPFFSCFELEDVCISKPWNSSVFFFDYLDSYLVEYLKGKCSYCDMAAVTTASTYLVHTLMYNIKYYKNNFSTKIRNQGTIYVYFTFIYFNKISLISVPVSRLF